MCELSSQHGVNKNRPAHRVEEGSLPSCQVPICSADVWIKRRQSEFGAGQRQSKIGLREAFLPTAQDRPAGVSQHLCHIHRHHSAFVVIDKESSCIRELVEK